MTPEEVKALYQTWKTKQKAVKDLEDEAVAKEAEKQVAIADRKAARDAYEAALDQWLTT